MLNLLSGLSGNSVKKISAEDAKKRLDANEPIILLDVREKAEYADRHIPNSLNLPLGSIDSVEKVVPDKNSPVFVYCLSGGRSARAANQMSKMGYSNIYNLGGIAGWQYETESSR
jgi:rhodanese-related sulfurtransferase